jgi:hypothetical protein
MMISVDYKIHSGYPGGGVKPRIHDHRTATVRAPTRIHQAIQASRGTLQESQNWRLTRYGPGLFPSLRWWSQRLIGALNNDFEGGAMGAYPGRVMTGVTDALAMHGKLSYRQLATMIYGPDFTDADRASMARAIRQLVTKGEVINYYEPGSRLNGQYVESGMWVRRPDVLHVETPRFHELPATNGNGNGAVKLAELSRAELLTLNPSYGDLEDCLSCRMPYSECFLLGDNMKPGEPWNGEPYRCCFECFHNGRRESP